MVNLNNISSSLEENHSFIRAAGYYCMIFIIIWKLGNLNTICYYDHYLQTIKRGTQTLSSIPWSQGKYPGDLYWPDDTVLPVVLSVILCLQLLCIVKGFHHFVPSQQ